nr:hypothetical protein [Tanacetum cinerariifolium]
MRVGFRRACFFSYSPPNSGDHRLRLGSFINQSGRELNTDKIKVFPSSQADHSAHHSPVAERILYLPRTILHGLHTDEGESSRSRDVYVPEWTIPQRSHVDSPMWCRELMVHLAPLTAQEESNALTNPIALERAWFNLARWAMA